MSIPTVVTSHHADVVAHPMEVMVNQRLNPIGERHVSPIKIMHISRFSGQCRRCETGKAFDRQADSTSGKGMAGPRPVATQAPDFQREIRSACRRDQPCQNFIFGPLDYDAVQAHHTHHVQGFDNLLARISTEHRLMSSDSSSRLPLPRPARRALI